MNKLDKDYLALVQDILDNGVKKQDRTKTGTISVFGRQIRHKMSDGFPLLTTKKMAWKQIVTELLWFLRGDTNIKYLVDNDCHIWDGDAYKNYVNSDEVRWPKSQEDFIEAIQTDDEFAKKWGELGPVYGKQWRSWDSYDFVDDETHTNKIDQIQNLINNLKTNPDSRRLMVSAWNVGELDQMVLPPCHYGFQIYTRELTLKDRYEWSIGKIISYDEKDYEKTLRAVNNDESVIHNLLDKHNIPTRAISLMWNQRSVDVGLGLPFNIASYGLLLEMIAKITNMVPDELIGNLGDTHLYLNHIEPIKEQIGRELTVEERMDWWFKNRKPNRDVCDDVDTYSPYAKGVYFNSIGVPKSNREPFELPKLITYKTDEFWRGFDMGVIGHLDPRDFALENYQSHPSIKLPLSN